MPENVESVGLMCAFFWFFFYLFCSTFATLIIVAVEQAETGVNLANLLYYLNLIFGGYALILPLLTYFFQNFLQLCLANIVD
jgi:hypothetical protein